MQDLQHVSESVWTALTKLFMALSGGNLALAGMAFLDLVPAISSLVGLMFLILVGMLTIRERRLSIKIKNMTIDDMERQRQVERGQG